MNKNTSHYTSIIHNAAIQINNFKLHLHIGVRDEERNRKQDIFLCLNLTPITSNMVFPGSTSDNIDDTVDYHALCNFLRRLEERKYCLIEKLALEIFDLTAEFLGNNCSIRCAFGIRVEVCKRPEIKELEGDVRFVLKGKIDLN